MFNLFGNKSSAEIPVDSIPEDVSLILDVRTPEEFRSGHVTGAVNIPLAELPRRIGEIEGFREKQILVYCHSGARSKRAVRFLEQNGFTEILHLHRGYRSLL